MKMNWKLSFLLLLTYFLIPSPTFATDCFSTLTGDQTMNVGTTCVLKTYVDGNNPARLVSGVDSGAGVTNSARLTLSSGSMTVSSNETLVVGELIIAGGSTAIASGGVIEIGKPMWMVDADADGYPTDTKIYVQSSAPTDGLRLNTMTDIATADCNDGSHNASNSCCVVANYYVDADGDGYGVGSPTSMCPASGYVANNTDCNDTGSNSANVWISTTCYVDADNDNYGSATSKTCTNNATCGSATWASGGAGTAAAATNLASNSTDCMDSNANVYPGSTFCSSTNRGDGSYDYNCSGTNTLCGTTRYSQYYSYCWTGIKSGCGTIDDRGTGWTVNGAPMGCGVLGHAQGAWYKGYVTSCQTCNLYLSAGTGYQACQ